MVVFLSASNLHHGLLTVVGYMEDVHHFLYKIHILLSTVSWETYTIYIGFFLYTHTCSHLIGSHQTAYNIHCPIDIYEVPGTIYTL